MTSHVSCRARSYSFHSSSSSASASGIENAENKSTGYVEAVDGFERGAAEDDRHDEDPEGAIPIVKHFIRSLVRVWAVVLGGCTT